MKENPRRASLGSRLCWFAILYLAGALVVFVAAAGLLLLLHAGSHE